MNEKTPRSSNAANAFIYPLAGIVILAAFLLFFRLGERPLRNPDEGRYADIAHEMAVSGDWVKPTVFGVAYLRKPPLFYWLVASSFRLFGESEWAARSVPALFGLLSVLLVFFFTRRFFDPESATLASLMLATNVCFVQVARYLVIDAVFSFFLTASLLVFYAALHSARRPFVLFMVFYLLLGAAFLTKGPASLVIVGGSVLAYLIATRRLGELGRLQIPAGIVVFLATAAPWFWAVSQREPWFPQFFFGHEHFQRFVSSDFEHQEPWYYYAAVLPALFLPWSLYVRPWQALQKGFEKKEQADLLKFLLLSAAVIAVFYSLSRSKLPTYVLPCLPLLCIAGGVAWKRWMDRKPSLGVAEVVPVLLIIAAAVALVSVSGTYLASHPDKYPLKLQEDIYWLGGSGLVGGVLCLRSFKMKRPGRLFISWTLMLVALGLLIPRVMERVNPLYSTQVFAEELRPLLASGDEVFIFDHPGPFYDFLFYLRHPVKLVGLEGELVYSRQDANAGGVSIGREEFFARIRADKRMYVLMRRSDYQEMDPSLRNKLTLLKEDARKVLVRT